MKRAKKPTKRKTKAVKQDAQAAALALANKDVAEHYVCHEMMEAIDRSLFSHKLEPTSPDCYTTIQLEGGRTHRIDTVVRVLQQAMDHYYEMTPSEAEDHPPLDEVIEGIYDDFADQVIHLYLDDKETQYLKPAEDIKCPECGTVHDEERNAKCADCGALFAADDEDGVWYNGTADEDGCRDGEMLCWDCFDDRPNVWSVCYQGDDGKIKLVPGHLFDDAERAKAAGKELATLNKGRLFMVSDAKGSELTTRFIEDIPLVMPSTKNTTGSLAQLAMFAGAAIGAGLASAAAKGASVRVAELADVANDAIETAGKVASV